LHYYSSYYSFVNYNSASIIED